MSEREEQIIKTIADAIPKMSERQKGRLLGYGEAVLDMRENKEKKKKQ